MASCSHDLRAGFENYYLKWQDIESRLIKFTIRIQERKDVLVKTIKINAAINNEGQNPDKQYF